MNTATATVSLTKSDITVKESTGYFNVPVALTGTRNGDVKVKVTTAPASVNGAEADKDYLMTTTEYVIPATDSIASIQIKTVDDDVINEARQFTVTIMAEGATVGNASTAVTIRDNDANFYEKFNGKWMLKYEVTNNKGTTPFEKEITISAESNEEAADYNKILTCTAPALINIGADIDCTWHFRYGFDSSTKKGSLAFILGEQVASFNNGAYVWHFVTDDGNSIFTDDVPTSWTLDEKGQMPTTITFNKDQAIDFFQPGDNGGVWAKLNFISMTKE